MKTRKNEAAVALGRKGGAAKTPEKAAAVRRNGALGGRPRCECGECRACKRRAKGDK